ncbi:methyltransferase domain-containing protein [Methanocella arvoryzae]|uniref:tRNA (guanine(10)-N(2))-dimethyltransferase n=1 Tax=Methanocella arvoryzae (strain DSM 22066 / NBRC 105507 / MRE50) TaxID=351160 RepID=Q0W6Y2_METAR|nr:THUMP domain-containing protein [Methanocella arvoryzae]CAJ35861.1 N2-methylguanosine tRNA methyltransferase [Methanocella arvoryzae MRE50]
MSQLVFELSGEHDTLPKSEVIACIEAHGWQYTVKGSYDQALILETDADPGVLARRLALTHSILELIFVAPSEPEEILKMAETADLKLKYGQSFVVRVSRVKNYGGISATFERKLGAAIWRRGYPVSLENPDVMFRAIVTEGVCIFGRRLAETDRRGFDERAPLKKPFFLPGVLMPRISRAVVNLTRISEGWILDPFSGTGGTLVEAGLISPDIHVVGCDIQKKMVYGTRKNLRHYGTNYDVIWEDSLRMGIKDDSVDAMVTDFPYGQSTPIAAASIDAFYTGALREMFRVLKPGCRAVVVSKAPMEKLLTDAGFTVIETHRQRIHKSLTRNFAVITKS